MKTFEELAADVAKRLGGKFEDGLLEFEDLMSHEDPDMRPHYEVYFEQVVIGVPVPALVAVDGVVLLADEDHIVSYIEKLCNLTG